MKKILIIGGSRGIGRAILEGEIEESHVVSISRKSADIEHENLIQYELDVLEDELPSIASLDSIIYCPGSINLKQFSRLKAEDFLSDYKVNVLGAIRVIKHYLQSLDKNTKSSSILMFSTVATSLGMPFHASVASSKGAVEGLVKSLAAELAPSIRVNAIAPTLTDTDLAAHILRNDKMKEVSKERHPLKRYLQPNDVANMASFLISNKASAISGQIIPVDAGITTLKL